MPAPNHANAQVRPIRIAARIRLRHFFIGTSRCGLIATLYAARSGPFSNSCQADVDLAAWQAARC